MNPSCNIQVSEPTAPAPAQLCTGKSKTCVSDGDQHQALLPPAHLHNRNHAEHKYWKVKWIAILLECNKHFIKLKYNIWTQSYRSLLPQTILV